jgi:Zn-dependent peptidase ImmA (M78 family)/transcriptional regulator with XRE-family HTH domain
MANIVEFPSAARATPAGRRLIPARLVDARKAARLNQTELSERIGVTRQAVSTYERGDRIPEAETFSRICEVLAQPAAFFTTEEAPVFGDYSVRFFRKFGPDTARRNDACAVYTRWFVQAAKYLEGHVNYPAVDVSHKAPADPTGRYSEEEIELAAEECRQQWGLGLGPISNVIALVESKGVAVCRYEIENERIDAFSFWNGERPFIFCASDRDSGARARFDVAHELGHLILHRWIEPEELENPKTLKLIEREADRFAGSFLLPRKSFPNEVYSPRLDAFLDLKRRWRVSIQAMIYRCSDLGVIDDLQFTNLYKQLSFRKWRTREPLDDPQTNPIEQPRLLRRAVEMIIEGKRRHPDEIAADLPFNRATLETLCNLPPGFLSPLPPAPEDLTLK